MKLNRALVMCLTIVLAVSLAIGGTVAYLTSTSGRKNVMAVGNVQIEQIEQQRSEDGALTDFADGPMLPAYYDEPTCDGKITIDGNEYSIFDESVDGEVDKIVSVANTGSEPAYIRTIFAFEDTADMRGKLHVCWNKGDRMTYPTDTLEDGTVDYVQFSMEDGTLYTVGVYVYPEAQAANTTTEPSMMQLFWDKTVDADWLANAQGEYEILVLSQAVQTQMGNKTAVEALNEAFGEISNTNEDKIKQWFADAGLLTGHDAPAEP